MMVRGVTGATAPPVSAAHASASARDMLERAWGASWVVVTGAKEMSRLMGSKAAWVRHSSTTGAFLETVLRTSLIGVVSLRVPFSMLTGVQLRSMASTDSGRRCCWERRSRASCHRASASDSRESSITLTISNVEKSALKYSYC